MASPDGRVCLGMEEAGIDSAISEADGVVMDLKASEGEWTEADSQDIAPNTMDRDDNLMDNFDFNE